MRHPTAGQNEDDLSRLTASSTTTSTRSHCSNDSKSCKIPIINTKDKDTDTVAVTVNNHHISDELILSYFPEIIDPLEWQRARKRKERQDSTSSSTQDRKLVRSNSEELISNADCEVIRRVSSHEDFKKPLQENNDANVIKQTKEIENGSGSGGNDGYKTGQKDAIKSRIETSPARSHRLSPHRDIRNVRYKENDEFDCENERRRSSERFSKTRVSQGRRTANTKKLSRHITSRLRERDENVYKYDISVMKSERRGFVSKFKLDERIRKEEAADGEKITLSDHNDNNLIDLHIKNEDEVKCLEDTVDTAASVVAALPEPSQTDEDFRANEASKIAEALPWDCSIQEDQTPLLCRRFAEYDNYPSELEAKLPIAPPATVVNEESKSFAAFARMENLKTREIMQSVPPPGLFFSPDDRLRQINKKLATLKKRASVYEENFETSYGYRPSQSDKHNDRQIKSVLSEINKLRREKQQLKSDPMAALGFKVMTSSVDTGKLAKITGTLAEIQLKLDEKRNDGNRSENLDGMTPNQLVQEKSAIQHCLLYFESLYGRPMTREERDAARPLYDRYRIIKRMIGRNSSISGCSIGAPELPTILEHEAMVFTSDVNQTPSAQLSEEKSKEKLEMPTITSAIATTTATAAVIATIPVESPSDNSASIHSTDSTDTSNQSTAQPSENVHTLSIDELWAHLDKLREEKKVMRRIIKEYEMSFEQQNGRKMLKSDRKAIEDTYIEYKQKKAKVRLLQALIKKKT